MKKILRIIILITVIFQLLNCTRIEREETYLPESGFYKECLNISIAKDKKIKINGIVDSNKSINICSNSYFELIDINGNIETSGIYFFESKTIAEKSLIDGVNLWYNSPSVVVRGKNTYIGYVKKDGTVSLSHLYENNLKKTVAIHKFSIGDDHSAPALMINAEGKIVILFSYHSSELYLAVSKSAYNIDEFEKTVIDKGVITYPSIIDLNGTDAIAFFRKGFSGNASKGEYHIIRSNDGGLSWNKSKPVIRFDNEFITFANPKYIEGEIHIPFTRLNRSKNTHENLYYTKSVDGGFTWQTKDGYLEDVNSSNALMLVEDTQIRVHDTTRYNDNIYISYSVYDNEYQCCINDNKSKIINVTNRSSKEFTPGKINYYSDGITFDLNFPRYGYKFYNDKDSTKSYVNVIDLSDMTEKITFELEQSSSINARFTSVEGTRPFKGVWVKINKYDSYNNFDTDLNFNLSD